MKILYGINSNGQGHINRSRVFITELLNDGHEVHVFIAGKKPPKYAFDLAPKVMYELGPYGVYENNRISVWKSWWENIPKARMYFRTVSKLKKLDKIEKYDAIFCDLEPISSIAGKRMKKPVVVIDHQNAIFHKKGRVKGRLFDKIIGWLTIKLLCPHYDVCYSLDFVDEISTHKKVTIYPLVQKQELIGMEDTKGKHILVYLNQLDEEKLVPVLTEFPDQLFYVYGYDKDEKVGNILYRKTSRDGFLEDMVSCKGIISNAGFNLTWEASLTNKLVWTIPLKNHIEQNNNAYRLEELDRAYIKTPFTKENMTEFLQWLKQKNYSPDDNLTVLEARTLIEHTYDSITRLQNEFRKITWTDIKERIDAKAAKRKSKRKRRKSKKEVTA